jgi:hypothetical protein
VLRTLRHKTAAWVRPWTVAVTTLLLAAGLLLATTAVRADAATPADPNLLSNGSFEGADASPGPTPGWATRNAGIAAYTGDGTDGSYFADLVAKVAGGSVYQDVPVAGQAGKTYQVSLWMRTASGRATVSVTLWGDLNGTGSRSVVYAVDTTWRRYSVRLQVRAATHSIRLQVGTNPGVHVRMDQALLTYQLLANPSFELGGGSPAPALNWSTRNAGVAAWANSTAVDGGRVLDFVPRAANGSVLQDSSVSAGLGQIVQASIWVKTPSTSARLALFGNMGGSGSASVAIPASTTWRQVTVPLYLRGRTTTLRLQVYANPGAHVTIDDALLSIVSPAAQTTPAPTSTSRYPRDLNGSAVDATVMKSRGSIDASNNPSGHAYIQLLDIGGQDASRGGVVLSATSRFLTYAQLVGAMKGYISGYASRQLPGAPAVIAIGTNNDMDVNSATGRAWATNVVNPLVTYAAGLPGLTIAGANDIEPGFAAGVAATRSWLSGFLAATSARFVFNGSADGCGWTSAGAGCNNGWRAADLYWLAGGAAPTRIINLPQIYNTTMAQQWRYISLTGVVSGQSKINFGGSLTEFTACQQAGSCYSMAASSAWSTLWSAIRADARTSQASLPYATDLKIN